MIFFQKWTGPYIFQKMSACYFIENPTTARHKYTETAVMTHSVNHLSYSKPLQAVFALWANFSVPVDLLLRILDLYPAKIIIQILN